MRKLIACIFLLAPAALQASPFAYTQSGSQTTARPGMTVNRVGAGSGRAAPAQGVPVTTTTTTNVFVPETSITNETVATFELDIDGRRAACLMTHGNVWASRLNANPFGIPLGGVLNEDPNPNNNVCFSVVSVSSSDIQNMGRFFPPRYFQSGTAVECGAWLDEAALDQAILDARRSGRVAGTIAAGVAGAVVGVTLTEIIGRQVGRGFRGQLDLEGDDQLASRLLVLKNDNSVQWAEYRRNVLALVEECRLFGDDQQRWPDECTSQPFEDIARVLRRPELQ